MEEMISNQLDWNVFKGLVEWQKISWILKRFIKPGMRGFDLGCGKQKIPGSIGIDRSQGSVADIKTEIKSDAICSTLTSYDYIFSSHFLEDFEWFEIQKISRRYCEVFLKPGGYFIAYVPHKGFYKGINLDHKHEFNSGDMESLLNLLGLETVLVYYEAYHESGMYGILGIGKK